MAISFSWSYESLEAVIGPDEYDHEDSVIVVNWIYNATDDEDPATTARTVGSVVVAWDEDSPAFVPFSDLTELTVDGWVEDSLGEEQIATMEGGLERNIAQQITPVTETFRTMPWEE